MAFVTKDYKLSADIHLCPISSDTAQQAGATLAKISPWVGINTAKDLETYLLAEGSAVYKYAVFYKNELVGVVCVRYPWLKGPYLELLGLFPQHQGKKIGSHIMAWFETTSSPRNLWLLASDFNVDAIAFYEHHGFERITLLEDLSTDGVHDVLMRKKLFKVGS